VDALASQQLAALARVGGLLESSGIDHWLFGGWAVDFYAGSITRAHDDIDVAVWLDDLPRIVALLEQEGWRHAPLEDEDGGTGYELKGVRLELTYLVHDAQGHVCIPLNQGLVRWPDDGLANDVGSLAGVRARLLGLAALARGKSTPRDDPKDAVNDRADFARLSAVAGEEP
jgi:hypothetical protein